MKEFQVILVGLLVISVCGFSTAPKTVESRQVLASQVDETIAVFKTRDPEIKRFFDESYGYVVFPKVTKGAIWVGGAYGLGEVYEQGTMVGFSSLSQATLGFSFGGEYFREIVFFQNAQAFNQFVAEEYAFSAQMTAVALTAGAAAKADYEYGKAVVIAETGLMVDVSVVGGQKFNDTPKPRIQI